MTLIFAPCTNANIRAAVNNPGTLPSIDAWDVSAVTDMAQLFDGKSDFASDISAWDVGRVTSMSSVFRDSDFNGDISAWDVGSVTSMHPQMFYHATSSTSFNGNISAWDVG